MLTIEIKTREPRDLLTALYAVIAAEIVLTHKTTLAQKNEYESEWNFVTAASAKEHSLYKSLLHKFKRNQLCSNDDVEQVKRLQQEAALKVTNPPEQYNVLSKKILSNIVKYFSDFNFGNIGIQTKLAVPRLFNELVKVNYNWYGEKNNSANMKLLKLLCRR